MAPQKSGSAPIIPSQCPKFRGSSDIKLVILHFRGPLYFQGSIGDEKSNPFLSFEKEGDTIKDAKEEFINGTKETIKLLFASGKEIAILIDVPELNFTPKVCIDIRPFQFENKRMLAKKGCKTSIASYERRTREYKEIIKDISTAYPQVKIFDPTQIFCDLQECAFKKEGKILYFDDTHLSIEGSKILGRNVLNWLDAEFKGI